MSLVTQKGITGYSHDFLEFEIFASLPLFAMVVKPHAKHYVHFNVVRELDSIHVTVELVGGDAELVSFNNLLNHRKRDFLSSEKAHQVADDVREHVSLDILAFEPIFDVSFDGSFRLDDLSSRPDLLFTLRRTLG